MKANEVISALSSIRTLNERFAWCYKNGLNPVTRHMGTGGVFQVKGGGIAEDEQLQERRHDHCHPAALVPEQGQHLLDDQGDNSVDHGLAYSRFFLVRRQTRPRKNTAMTRSAAELGTTTLQTSPTRKSVCSMET